jgi:hypothetical protein
MPRLYIDRLMHKRPGFRAKISRDWYVFEEGRVMPILGPFPNRRVATMAKDETTKTNRGQEKTHTVTNPDGSTVEMTQKEWRERDKSLGQTRPDGDDSEADETDGETSGAGTGSESQG